MIVPKKIKNQIRYFIRLIKDIRKGYIFHFASPGKRQSKNQFPFNSQITIQQKIFPGHLSENKVHNMKIATSRISNVPIYSQEIFSFFNFVGDPTFQKGYKTGRTLVNGSLDESIGGGLCQLAGLIFHLALESGMEILERHNHSIDIYTEETRYTPLGLDAAVSYLQKDLRFRNCYNFPVCLTFEVSEKFLAGTILSPQKIPKFSFYIESESFGDIKKVSLYRKLFENPSETEHLGTSIYRNSL
ncbi:MAG: VanW family protein [Leptospiraceae bacterium]|nr:VanW family protein [Leptospiraceae bacterium]